jgi:hypothetical protein
MAAVSNEKLTDATAMPAMSARLRARRRDNCRQIVKIIESACHSRANADRQREIARKAVLFIDNGR